ncbi:UNVERIFIED_CONTAM: hypothetical protein FKN15_017717 [Acipenser sinensis]
MDGFSGTNLGRYVINNVDWFFPLARLKPLWCQFTNATLQQLLRFHYKTIDDHFGKKVAVEYIFVNAGEFIHNLQHAIAENINTRKQDHNVKKGEKKKKVHGCIAQEARVNKATTGSIHFMR